MKHVSVQYHNDTFGTIPDLALDNLISSLQIKKFYRPSEKRWVTVGYDRVRGAGGLYSGPDRRVEGYKISINKSSWIKSRIVGSIFILLGIVGLYYCLKHLCSLNDVDLTQLITRFPIWNK